MIVIKNPTIKYRGFKIVKKCNGCIIEPNTIIDCILLCRTYNIAKKVSL
jgi:hypothetical protein